METFAALYGRRSIREFIPGKPIPDAVMNRLLAAAARGMAGPGGSPLWKLIVVKDPDTRELLAASAKEVAMTLFGASFEVFGPGHLWYMPRDTQLRVAEYTATGDLWTYPRTAGVNFVPCTSRGGWVDTVTSFSDDLPMLVQFLGFAAMNMWLVGHKYGLGAAYNGMPLLDGRRRELAFEHLGCPYTWEPTGCFSFGYPKAPRPFGPARPALEGVTFSEYWGNPYLRVALRLNDYETGHYATTEIEEVIHNIRLVRSFADGPVPDWMLEKILDAAMYGPVPENFKAYRFLVIKDSQSKAFLQQLVAEKRKAPWWFAWPEVQYSRVGSLSKSERLEAIDQTYARGLGDWYTQADTLVLVMSTFMAWRDQPDPGYGATPMPMFHIAEGCCIQNMMIAATALGLGVNYDATSVGDPRTRELLCDYFAIPDVTWWPMGVLALGEAGERLTVGRLPIETMVYDEYWNNPYHFKEEVSK